MLTIEYTAQLRRAAGLALETIELAPGSTLQDIAHQAADRHGDELRKLLLDRGGRLQRSVLVFVGDEQMPPDSPTPLRDGQTITFAAPISGG